MAFIVKLEGTHILTYTLGVTHPDGSFKSLPDTVKEH